MDKKLNLGFTEKTKYFVDDERYIEIDDADTNIVTRLTEICSDISNYLDENEVEAEANVLEKAKKMKEADLFIKERINYAFDSDVSSVLFGNASCLSVTKKGEYYFENAVSCLVEAMGKTMDVNFGKMNERMKKYAMQKGKHPALKK